MQSVAAGSVFARMACAVALMSQTLDVSTYVSDKRCHETGNRLNNLLKSKCVRLNDLLKFRETKFKIMSKRLLRILFLFESTLFN